MLWAGVALAADVGLAACRAVVVGLTVVAGQAGHNGPPQAGDEILELERSPR